MEIEIVAATGAYAAINIAGPAAREILRKMACDVDLSGDAFPYMTVRMGTLDGIRARLIRVGFVGELGYEIHVPALYAEALWDRLLDAGRGFGLQPFGVEAQRLLRLEKGHAIIGQDTDGLTTPPEANMALAISKKKADYWGRAAIEARSRNGAEKLLVGFRLKDPAAPVPPECCLVIDEGEIAGRVTSASASAACGGVIGLCVLAAEHAVPGTEFQIKLPDGRFIEATVVPTPFYDPGNERQAH